MKNRFFSALLVLLLFLSACQSAPSATAPEQPSQPPATATLPQATTAPTQAPAQASTQLVATPEWRYDQFFPVYQGGYNIQCDSEMSVTIRGAKAMVGAQSLPISFLFNGKLSAYDLQEAAPLLRQEMELALGRSTDATYGEMQSFTQNGFPAVSMEYKGTFSNFSLQGKAVLIRPSTKQFAFVLGMAEIGTTPQLWQEQGQALLTQLVDHLNLNTQANLDELHVCPKSDDPLYGLDEAHAIPVGGTALTGFTRVRAYLDNLNAANDSKPGYELLQSIDKGASMIDVYQLDLGDGQSITLYFDRFHWQPLHAPASLNCQGLFPLAEPVYQP